MILRFFQEGGYGMWVVLVLGLAVIVVAGLFASGEERARWGAWGLVAACVVAGAAFMMQGRSRTEDAVANIDGELRGAIIEQGYQESSRPLQLGIGLAIVGAVIAGVGEARRRKK